MLEIVVISVSAVGAALLALPVLKHLLVQPVVREQPVPVHRTTWEVTRPLKRAVGVGP